MSMRKRQSWRSSGPLFVCLRHTQQAQKEVVGGLGKKTPIVGYCTRAGLPEKLESQVYGWRAGGRVGRGLPNRTGAYCYPGGVASGNF